MRLVLDPTRSHVRAFTTTEGLLARLAHDLEVAVRDISGEADEGTPAKATIRIGVGGIDVVGVVKRGVTHPNALAPWERDQIALRMRTDVFSDSEEVRVEATIDGDQARFEVILPHARESVRAPVALERSGHGVTVKGTLAISLRGLGVGPLKGPMGAFVVADRVRVVFDVTFTRP